MPAKKLTNLEMVELSLVVNEEGSGTTWAPRNEQAIIFAHKAGRKPTRLEAMVCTVNKGGIPTTADLKPGPSSGRSGEQKIGEGINRTESRAAVDPANPHATGDAVSQAAASMTVAKASVPTREQVQRLGQGDPVLGYIKAVRENARGGS